MHEFSLEYLKCVKCCKKLELEILKKEQEIIEGFLICNNCKTKYPIISKIPIIWNDFSSFLSNRTKLGGDLLLCSKTSKMKNFVKKSLSKIKKADDITWIEKKWTLIYLKSEKSEFYSKIRKSLKRFSSSNIVLEHGCSVGIISEFLAKQNKLVFGIDSSFYAIKKAKQTKMKNLDFFVTSSLYHPFGKQKFDLIVGLNLLEIIEPKKFIKIVSDQMKKGILLISDPYDFERGLRSVKNPIDPKTLREEFVKHGFKILQNTKTPSYISWNLNINPRSKLHYKVDLVIGKK